MKEKISLLESEATQELKQIDSASKAESFRIKYLGKKSKLTELFKELKGLSSEDKATAGVDLNRLKNFLQDELDKSKKQFGAKKVKSQIDTSLPGLRPAVGKAHILSETISEIVSIFKRIGFSVGDGPEIETEFHNFTALNVPEDHPSRDSIDTFYTEEGTLLRSQTSTVQIRIMENTKPPLRIIAPGRVYRPDTVDATHSFMFHQIEGLMVDKEVTFAELKGVLNYFLKELFGSQTKTRFRPHFFPFTEPSVEVDIEWKGKGWLEILGAGSVDPNVFEAVGYDPKEYKGFAFGLGIERIAMMRYGINDIRHFYENDIRFLKQFR